MFMIAVNNPSFETHFSTGEKFYENLASIISIIDSIDRGLRAGSAILMIDSSVENFEILADGTPFLALIGNWPDRDMRQKWFVYSRNRAIPLSYERTKVSFSLKTDGKCFLETDIVTEIATSAEYYLSASVRNIFCCEEFDVTPAGHKPKTITNSRSKLHLKSWWPIFEPSDKHKKHTYYIDGELVSSMPLTNAEAQEALEISTLVGKERHVNFRGGLFRFLPTHPGRNIYHGFLVEE